MAEATSTTIARSAAYIPFGSSLSEGQKETLSRAARDGSRVTIRLSLEQLHCRDKLGLTKRQIARVMKKKGEGAGAELKFSKTQLKKMTKMGGILPLLTLIPMILGGLSAAGALAGGAAGIAKAVQNKKANDAANAEAKRHNREVEAQLKGSGLYLGRETRGGCCPMCRGNGLFLSKN